MTEVLKERGKKGHSQTLSKTVVLSEQGKGRGGNRDKGETGERKEYRKKIQKGHRWPVNG